MNTIEEQLAEATALLERCWGALDYGMTL